MYPWTWPDVTSFYSENYSSPGVMVSVVCMIWTVAFTYMYKKDQVFWSIRVASDTYGWARISLGDCEFGFGPDSVVPVWMCCIYLHNACRCFAFIGISWPTNVTCDIFTDTYILQQNLHLLSANIYVWWANGIPFGRIVPVCILRLHFITENNAPGQTPRLQNHRASWWDMGL